MPLLFIVLRLICLVGVLSAPVTAQPALRPLNFIYGPDPLQKLDVYLPPHPRNAPILFLVHGGGWRFGDKSDAATWRHKAEHWTKRGAVVVSTNYRLLPVVAPLEQARDVARALAFVQKKAPLWGAEPQRLVMMGHSAGGHLTALLSADPALAWAEGAQAWLASVVLDSAALNVPAIMQTTPSYFHRQAFGPDAAIWAAASPYDRLTPVAPPILLVCSTRRSQSCPQADGFAAQLSSLGGTAQVLPLPLSHRSVNEQLGLHPDYTDAIDSFLTKVGFWSHP